MNPFDKRRSFLASLSKLKLPKKNQINVIAKNLFIKCPQCKKTNEKSELKAHNNVCTYCGHHFYISAYSRLKLIFDENKFKELNRDLVTKNPLNFPDYSEKIKDLTQKNKVNESVVTAVGQINGEKAVVCVMDTKFLMGSMGAVCGERITRAIEYATQNKLPIIIYTASGGARMQEGIISLFQMAKTSAALKKHSDANLLYISVLTHPTTGGVTASFAMLGDIIIAEPKALIGFAGPRVIEQTIGEKLPKEAQKAEFVLKHGFVDIIAKRNEQKQLITHLIKMFTKSK